MQKSEQFRPTSTSQFHSTSIENFYEYEQEVLSPDSTQTEILKDGFCDRPDIQRYETNNEATNLNRNRLVIDLTFDDYIFDLEDLPEHSLFYYPLSPPVTPMKPYWMGNIFVSRGQANLENPTNSSHAINSLERRNMYESPVNELPAHYSSPPLHRRPSDISLTPENIYFDSSGYAPTKSQYCIEPHLPNHAYGRRPTEIPHEKENIFRNSNSNSIHEVCAKHPLLSPRMNTSKGAHIQGHRNHVEPSKNNKSIVITSVVGHSGAVIETQDFKERTTTKMMYQTTHQPFYGKFLSRRKYPLPTPTNKMDSYCNPSSKLPHNLSVQYPIKSRIQQRFDALPNEIYQRKEMDNFASDGHFETANSLRCNGPYIPYNYYGNIRH